VPAVYNEHFKLRVSIHLLAGIAIFATSSESALGNIIIALTAIEVMVGMVIAIPGALLGISLRVWLFRKAFYTPPYQEVALDAR